MSNRQSRKRPWLAALLAFLHPGLGHLYLRRWIRAVLWFGLAIATAALVIPESAVPQSDGSLQALLTAAGSIPIEAQLAILWVTVLSIVDAYWLATRHNKRVETGSATRCPNCGKEIDEDLEFCQWCTTPLTDQ